MPRQPRSEVVGDGFVHVTARGNRRDAIFRTPLDHYEHLLLLGDALERHPKVVCHGYCLMPNHFHLVLEAPQRELSTSMQRLNGIYAQRFNRRYGLSGHVFQGRFGAEPILSESHLLEVVRYVVLNPFRAGVCEHPRDWPWSSYGAYLDDSLRPPFLTTSWTLALFGADVATARGRLARFIDDGLSRYPKPYVPPNFSASRRTRSAPGRPTTFK